MKILFKLKTQNKRKSGNDRAIIRMEGLMLPSKRPLYMGNILNVALKIGNINLATLINFEVIVINDNVIGHVMILD